MEQKSIIRNKISNVLQLATFGVLFLLVFIFPFKFNMPFAEGFSQFFPENLNEWVFFSWPEGIAYFLIVLSALLTIFRLWAEGEITFYRTPFDLWILGFLSVLVVSFCFSLNHFRSQVFLIRAFMCFLLYYIVIYSSVEFKLWRFIVIAVVAAGMVLCLYGLYQFFYGLNETRIWVMQTREGGFSFSEELLQRLSGNRVFSTFVYPNAFAGYLLFCIPVSFSVFWLKGKDAKIRFFGYPVLISLICAVLFLIMIGKKTFLLNVCLLLLAFPLTVCVAFFLTLSKGGILSFLLAVFLFLFFYKRTRNKKVLLLVVSLCAVFILAYFFLPQEIKSTIMLRLKAGTLKVRLDYWKVAFGIFKDYPLLGCGSDNYGLLYPLYWQKQTEVTQLAHNNYLQILAETGIFGAFFFCGFALKILHILANFFKKFKIDNSASEQEHNKNIFLLCLGVSLLAVLIHFAVDFDLYIFSLFAYFTVFLAFFTAWSGKAFKPLFVLKGWRLHIILFLFFTVLVIFILSARDRMKADFAFFQARQHYQKGNMNLAVKKAQKAAEIAGENHIYSFFISRVFLKAGQYPASLYWGQKTVQQNKYMGDAYKQMADIYLFMQKKEKKDYGKKIEMMLKKACFYAPHKLKYKTALVDFYMAREKYEEALLKLKEAYVFWPDDKIILDKLNKCRLLLNKGS